jgi:hypothetical protein
MCKSVSDVSGDCCELSLAALDDRLDDALCLTFPASDPIALSGTAGGPSARQSSASVGKGQGSRAEAAARPPSAARGAGQR